MSDSISDQWRTPQSLFEELDQEFNFNIDLCATEENTKCDIWYQDYLNDVQIEKVYLAPRVATMQEYHEIGDANYTCFMNPPYSNPKSFIDKAWEDSKHCRIVCLVKCDPSTKWWATFWNYDSELKCNSTGRTKLRNGPKPGCEVRFFPKRIKFDPPQQLIDTGKVWKLGNKWYQICKDCTPNKYYWGKLKLCPLCKGKGYKELPGPTFSSALIIMDRRQQ